MAPISDFYRAKSFLGRTVLNDVVLFLEEPNSWIVSSGVPLRLVPLCRRHYKRPPLARLID